MLPALPTTVTPVSGASRYSLFFFFFLPLQHQCQMQQAQPRKEERKMSPPLDFVPSEGRKLLSGGKRSSRAPRRVSIIVFIYIIIAHAGSSIWPDSLTVTGSAWSPKGWWLPCERESDVSLGREGGSIRVSTSIPFPGGAVGARITSPRFVDKGVKSAPYLTNVLHLRPKALVRYLQPTHFVGTGATRQPLHYLPPTHRWTPSRI